MTMAEDIVLEGLIERERQKKEGFSFKHDDAHIRGELASAAAYYTKHAATGFIFEQDGDDWKRYQNMWPQNMAFPWDGERFKPKNPRRDLIKALALIIAEIERLDRRAVAIDEK